MYSRPKKTKYGADSPFERMSETQSSWSNTHNVIIVKRKKQIPNIGTIEQRKREWHFNRSIRLTKSSKPYKTPSRNGDFPNLNVIGTRILQLQTPRVGVLPFVGQTRFGTHALASHTLELANLVGQGKRI